MDPIPRDLTDSGKDKYMAKLTNEDLFKSISLGGRGIDKSGLMPPFGKTLSEKEVWIIVSYVKKLYKGSPNVDFSKKISNDRPKVVIKDVNIEPPDRRAILNGKRAYGRFGCSGCHKIKGRGGISGPDLSKIGRKLKSEVIYRVTQSAEDMDEDSSMPVYALPEKAGVSITRYLMSLE